MTKLKLSFEKLKAIKPNKSKYKSNQAYLLVLNETKSELMESIVIIILYIQ